MDANQLVDIDELDTSWSENTSPSSDDIESIARHILPTPVDATSSAHGSHRRHSTHSTAAPGTDPIVSGAIHMLSMSVQPAAADPSSAAAATFALVKSPSIFHRRMSAAGFLDRGEDHEADMMWDPDGDDDDVVMPKIEELDDDVELGGMNPVLPPEPNTAHEAALSTREIVSPTKVKKRRGRPRKYPLQTPAEAAAAQTKNPKGRSKTGCLTCRKRKKKCDETKPRCMNCEKNAVVCEGYPERTYWKSGKEKAEEAHLRISIPTIRLQPIINGVETSSDRMFFEHYVFHLSTIFTFEGERNNAFKDMLLPLAVQHVGLMHSILALSSRHINYQEPYGVALLEKHPEVDEPSALTRGVYHHDEALRQFHKDIDAQREGQIETPVLSARYGQMLCLVLETLMEGDPTGSHRVHLQAYQRLIKESPPEDGPFLEFIQEFFQYHIAADELVSLPPLGRARLGDISDSFSLPPSVIQPEAVRLLGVQDGLFFHMSKITKIRNQIRERIMLGLEPPVDYESLYLASEIDAGIRDWTPPWPAGDSRDLAGMVYKQMMWVYLYRTVYPPRTTAWVPDPRIVAAVDGGLELLAQFSRNDRSQTILLAPSFILGCAAFMDRQRQPLREAIGTIRTYTGLSNADRVLQVLEEVWRLMDEKSERSWDWQNIAKSMGMDFLAT